MYEPPPTTHTCLDSQLIIHENGWNNTKVCMSTPKIMLFFHNWHHYWELEIKVPFDVNVKIFETGKKRSVNIFFHNIVKVICLVSVSLVCFCYFIRINSCLLHDTLTMLSWSLNAVLVVITVKIIDYKGPWTEELLSIKYTGLEKSASCDGRKNLLKSHNTEASGKKITSTMSRQQI